MSVVASSAPARSGFSLRLLVILLLAVAAPLVLYLIGRSAAVGLKPPLAASLPPAEYSPMLRRLMPAIADPRRPVPAQIVALARRAAAREPLAYEPFFILSRHAADRGDMRSAIRLMEEARRRRPNHILTRLLLISYHGGEGRFADALAQMDYALRSSENVRTAVFPELVKTMRTAPGRRAVADVLAKQPEWRPDFIRALRNERSLDVAQAQELLTMLRARRPNANWNLERDLYIDALVRSGEIGRARALWLQGLPKARGERYRLLANGSFADAPLESPFAWSVREQTAGRAEIMRSARPYLQVDYFGGQTVLLAEQLLGLAPGTYQLSFEAKSDEGIKSGDLFWSVTCTPEGPELTRIRLNAAQPVPRRIQGTITVPASGCRGQNLRLIAEPGDVATGYTAQIANMQLVRR